MFVIDGMRKPVPMGLVAAAGKPAEEIRCGVRFEELHRGGWDPEARMADQARDGVAAEIIYPTVGMVLCNHRDLDYKQACFDAYNRWIAEYCAAHPDAPARHRADRDAHARGGHRRPGARSSALGLRGVMMPGSPAVEDYDIPVYDRSGRRPSTRPAALVPHPDQRATTGRGRAGRSMNALPRDHPRLPGHHGHAGLRRRLRAPPEAKRRVRRGRRRLGAALHVPHGPRLQAPPLLAAAGPELSQAAVASTSPRTST